MTHLSRNGDLTSIVPKSSNFWTAFYGGVAAPIMLFSPVQSYERHAYVANVAQCFSVVGAYMTEVIPMVVDDRRAPLDAA